MKEVSCAVLSSAVFISGQCLFTYSCTGIFCGKGVLIKESLNILTGEEDLEFHFIMVPGSSKPSVELLSEAGHM